MLHAFSRRPSHAALIALMFATDENVGILPGGHSPLYMVAGVMIGGMSLWWFGAFDRPI